LQEPPEFLPHKQFLVKNHQAYFFTQSISCGEIHFH